MALWRRLRFSIGFFIASIGVVVLVGSFAAYFYDLGRGTGAALLFIVALLIARAGALMIERDRCDACGNRGVRASSGCANCDDAASA